MNNLQIFQNPQFGEVRVIQKDGEPWFVAVDVCRVLEISNPTDALKRLDDDERARFNLGHPMNETNCVNEPGLYSLVLGSRKPEARAFKRWITHDVIPSIRQHGLYAAPDTLEQMLADPDTAIRLLTEVKRAREKVKALETENEAQRQAIADFEPKRQYLDTILNSTGVLAVTQIAADYGISAKRLNKILHEEGIQRKVNGQWILYREHMGKGYTKSATIPITHEDGTPDAKLHTYFTQRGRLMIHQILTNRGILAVMDRPA